MGGAAPVHWPGHEPAALRDARAYDVKLRQLIGKHKELARKLAGLEQRVDTHDGSIRQLIDAIQQLMPPPPEPKRRGRIGFGRENDTSPHWKPAN